MKNSIKVLIITMVIGIQGIRLRAQEKKAVSGIYLNEQDYKTGKLSYIPAENDKLQLHSFLGGQNINLSYQGKKIKLSKNAIFGYRKDNQDYRLYKNEAYRILDTAGFPLYSRTALVQQGKGYKQVELLFFSTAGTSTVQSLTVANISGSFADLINFRYNVQDHFHRDADLTAYDKQSNAYEVKELYFMHKMEKQTQHAAL